MRAHFQDNIRVKSQRLAELRNKAAEIERKLSDARLSLEREIEQSARTRQLLDSWPDEGAGYQLAGLPGDDQVPASSFCPPAEDLPDCDPEVFAGTFQLAEERTEILVSRGRRSASGHRLARWHKVAIAAAAAAIAIAAAVTFLAGGSPAWPASVARMQADIARACRNPDVKSEPAQVNFACARGTRQILWVFGLMTSAGNPRFRDPRTGRAGLEPITPAQGGEIAWSLNLHHAYDPASPLDSLQVAARAINNIIGGATVTGPNGKPVVQPGLESSPANCIRYTGSAAVTVHDGFPAECARPVKGLAGQAALVADVYQKWVVGAPPADAQAAAVLFANADNPASPQVQAILRQLPARRG